MSPNITVGSSRQRGSTSDPVLRLVSGDWLCHRLRVGLGAAVSEGPGGLGAVIRVNPVTGGQSVVSESGLFTAPHGVALEADGDILITDREAVIRVDPVTGAQTALSTGGSFDFLYGITVVPGERNRDPIANPDSATTKPATPVTIDVLANDSDPNGDRLSVTEVSDPPRGTATRNSDSTVTYRPDCGFRGTDTFTYTISDGRGGTASALVTVTVRSTSRRTSC